MDRNRFDELRRLIEGSGPADARHACRLSRQATAHIGDRIAATYLNESLAAALCMVSSKEQADTIERAARRRRALNLIEMVEHA